MRAPRDRRGQLSVPFLLAIPAFFLFVVAVIEIISISREKIRQQFALDISATLEMESYTDLLNKLAYLNGVFPHRIFKGANSVGGGATGAYPAASAGFSTDDPLWPIRYQGLRAYANVPDDGVNPPDNFGILHMHLPGEGGVAVGQAEQVAYNYISVYQWLGDVATSQKITFEKTVLLKHDQLRQSMWMNLLNSAGSGCSDTVLTCGSEASNAFGNISIRMHYLEGFKNCPVIVTIAGQSYVGELTSPFKFSGSGLWQLATVPQPQVDAMCDGWVAKTHFDPGPNHFKADWVPMMQPYVRAKVATCGGHLWPDTTPKYYTRLYP